MDRNRPHFSGVCCDRPRSKVAYEPGGRRFESCRARQSSQQHFTSDLDSRSVPDAAKETSGAGASCPQWVSDELARDGLRVAPVTIWRLLRRHVLGTRAQRLAVVECHTVATVGLVTERTARLRRRRRRHADAQRPGDLLSLDTFCVGKLKGVGKVWQITACDCATSYAWAQLVPGEVTADAVAA